MYPPAFDYEAPEHLDEAVGLLAEHGDEARVLAGGQSLIPLLKLRFAFPGLLVDLNRIPELSYIEEDDDALRIGAMTRHADVERASLAGRYGAIAAAAPLISDPLVRNLGTVGGSLAHADPAGDWASVMLAVGAEVTARGADGERTIAMADLIDTTFTTTLERGEVLSEIRVPRPAGPAGGTYLKLERKVGDFATVGVAVHIEMDDGVIGRAGIGLTAVGPSNIAVTDAAETLAGAEPGEEAYAEAAELAAAAARPTSDVRGSAEYKRGVVRTYVRRGLEQAVATARNGA